MLQLRNILKIQKDNLLSWIVVSPLELIQSATIAMLKCAQLLMLQHAQLRTWPILLTHVLLQHTTIQLDEEDVTPNANEQEDQNSTDQPWLKSPRQ